MSGGGSAEAINKTARDDSGDEAEAAPVVSGSGKNFSLQVDSELSHEIRLSCSTLEAKNHA